MLEATARLVDEGRGHAGVELLFTPMEEIGLLGAEAFDEQRLQARAGYVYDHAGPIGEVILGAPYQTKLDVDVPRPRRARRHVPGGGPLGDRGRGPRDRRPPARAARRRDDRERGRDRGGTARNVVPEHCSFDAEARSHDEGKLAELVQEMLETITFAASLAECEVETQVEGSSRGYRFRRDDLPVRLATSALERTGREPSFILSGGGADANVFNERGLQCVNLANGMTDIHTPDERIAVDDLEAMVDVTLALVDVAAAESSERPSVPLSLRRGRVTAIVEEHEGLVRLEVDGTACVAYPWLTGPVALDDDVLVNVQARELGLGSGGFDVLHANLTRGLDLPPAEGAHVMKLPYTPLQAAALHAEEAGPLADDLDGMPVVCCSLHSQLSARVRRARRRASRCLRAGAGRGACRCGSRTRSGRCGSAGCSRRRSPQARASAATSRASASHPLSRGPPPRATTPWSARSARGSSAPDPDSATAVSPRRRRSTRPRLSEVPRCSPRESRAPTSASGTVASRTTRRACSRSAPAASPSPGRPGSRRRPGSSRDRRSTSKAGRRPVPACRSPTWDAARRKSPGSSPPRSRPAGWRRAWRG